MKKFLAIVFTLIFALSACTVAFAADAAPVHTCTNCGFKFDTTTAYNDHIKTCKPEEKEDTENVKHVCSACATVFPNRTEYMAHMNGGCDTAYKTCGYCEARIDSVNLSAHEYVCTKYSESCAYCGKDFDKKADYEAHFSNYECKVINAIGDKIKVAEIVDKIIEFLKGVDWAGLFAKVGELVGGIDFEGLIGKVTGFIGGIDFEGLLGKVSGAVEGLGK